MSTAASSPIVCCLWFDDQADEAVRFYTQTFSDSRVLATAHYPESFDNPGGRPRGSVLTIDFELAGQRFTALNGGPHFSINPSISFFVHAQTPNEVDGLFAALAEGGKVLMPIDAYPWSERYGWVEDRFGVSWQVICGASTSDSPSIVPCLMFAEEQFGRAEEAIERYTAIFPRGQVERLERYTAERGPEGKIVHGRYSIAGQEMVAMDGHERRGFVFNEGLSLQVLCGDQAEVDRFWLALSDGGEQGVCGWLKDRFGLSWQIVPTMMPQWLASEDRAARDRVFTAMLQQRKPDIAALERAFRG